MTTIKTIGNSDRVSDMWSDVLLAFAREPNFKEMGPGACIYAPTYFKDPRSFTFGDPPNEPAFHRSALLAYGQAKDRSIFELGLQDRVPFVAVRAESQGGILPTLLVFYGWPWEKGQAFLLALASRLGLSVPRQARLSTEAKNNLSPAVRALLV